MGMGFLKENLLRLIALLIMLIAFTFFIRYFTVNENFYNRMLKIRIEEHYSGVILQKYIDTLDHSTPKLKLTNTVISLEKRFWDQVSIGDSIVKMENEAYITLYKVNKEKVIFNYNEYFKELIERKNK